MSSRSLKRAREDDMYIKVASGQLIPAKSLLLRTFSTCAEQLPAGTEEWDVSGFRRHNSTEAFSDEAVKCWLNCGHSILHGAAELDADDAALLSTAAGLHEVLSFAHAVGSPEGVLNAACRHLHDLEVVVKLPEQCLKLCMGSSYAFYNSTVLQHYSLSGLESVGSPLLSEQQASEVTRQVAAQIEGLLHMAYMLRLQQLIDVLHNFVFENTRDGCHVVSKVLDLVFTDLVLEAALGSGGGINKDAFVNNVLTQPCSLIATPFDQGLFKPTGPFKIRGDSGQVMFQAQLVRDFAGGKAGDCVTAGLCLFDGDGLGLTVYCDDEDSNQRQVWYPARLLVGNSVEGAGSFKLKCDSVSSV